MARNKRVKVKIHSSIKGMPMKEYAFRLNPSRIEFHELGKRGSEGVLPWSRVVASALIFKPAPDQLEPGTDFRKVEVVLDPADRQLSKQTFIVAILHKGLGVRRFEDPPGWRILSWRSLIGLSLRGRW